MGPSVICGAWPEGGGSVRCLSTRQPRGPGTGNSRPGPGAWGARLPLGAGGRRGCRGWSPCRRRSANSQRGRGELGHLPAGEPRQNPSDGRSSRPARCPVLQPRPLPLPTPRAQGKEALAGRGLPTASALPRAWERRPPLLPSPRGPRGWGGGGGLGGGLWESESLGSDVTLAASRTR